MKKIMLFVAFATLLYACGGKEVNGPSALVMEVNSTGTTLSNIELGIPGVYGLLGLEWTYVKGEHQLLYRKAGYSSEYVFLAPKTNQIISFQLQETPVAGETVEATLVQNVNVKMGGKLEHVVLSVVKVDSKSLQLSNPEDPSQTAILYRK